MKEKTLIELNIEDIKNIICQHYNLNAVKTTIRYNYTPDTQREPEYLNIIVTGEKKIITTNNFLDR